MGEPFTNVHFLSNQNGLKIAVNSYNLHPSPFLIINHINTPFILTMVESDNDSELSSSSHDVFDTNNDIERYEDLLLRDCLPSTQLPSITAWKYDAFTDRGSEFIGDLKKSVAKEDKSFNLKYNTIDGILFEKAETELK